MYKYIMDNNIHNEIICNCDIIALIINKYHHLCTHIPYSRKVWRKESLANLANERHFTKLKSAKIFHLVQIYLRSYRQIRQTFSCQDRIVVSKFTKVSTRQTFLLYGTQLYDMYVHNSGHTYIC